MVFRASLGSLVFGDCSRFHPIFGVLACSGFIFGRKIPTEWFLFLHLGGCLERLPVSCCYGWFVDGFFLGAFWGVFYFGVVDWGCVGFVVLCVLISAGVEVVRCFSFALCFCFVLVSTLVCSSPLWRVWSAF